MSGSPDEAVLERALSLCSEACFTVALQRRRLGVTEPEDEVFVFRWWADLQFFIVALRRLRRSAELAARIPGVSKKILEGIETFDKTLPDLAKMRNVGEHIDDYAVDASKRRYGDVGHQHLQAGTWDGRVYRWIGELDVDVSLGAAEQLFSVVKEATHAFIKVQEK